MTVTKVRLAMAAMGKRKTRVADSSCQALFSAVQKRPFCEEIFTEGIDPFARGNAAKSAPDMRTDALTDAPLIGLELTTVPSFLQG